MQWATRCIICGDSKKSKTKTRGSFYVRDGTLMYGCFNCGASQTFATFLKSFDANLYREFCLEKYKDENPNFKPVEKPVIAPENKTEEKLARRLIDKIMDRLDTLPDDNEAVKFALSRHIPRDKFDQLYFVENVCDMEQLSPKYRDRIKGKEPRLVLPFYDWDGKMIGFTARGLRNEELRYITVKIREDVPMIFGTETYNDKKKGYVVEGPIDSLFLPNCIAVAGTGFNKLDELPISKKKLTVVIDNQPRNKEVVKIYQKFINLGYNIVVWPQTLHEKDINDMILSGLTQKQLVALIERNTHQGLSAQAAFLSWKRI